MQEKIEKKDSKKNKERAFVGTGKEYENMKNEVTEHMIASKIKWEFNSAPIISAQNCIMRID